MRETQQSSEVRLERIRKKLDEDPEEILRHFHIDYVNKGDYFKARCPCHRSDNEISFTLWKQGAWACHSRNCNQETGSDLIGLIWGILNLRKEKKLSFPTILDYCEENLGKYEGDVYIEDNLTKICNILNKKSEELSVIGDKSILKELRSPSPYYLSMGFSKEILNKFYIGDCFNPQKPMFNRAVCPIFEENGEKIIGAAGRRIPDKDYLQKWKYSYGFKSGSYLYGLWLAKSKILETSRVILVEGMMDVAKLHEMGYTETVGMFGVNLTANHIGILNRLGVTKVLQLLDGDEAGELASKRNYEKCKDYFNFVSLKCPQGKDPDELSKIELNSLFKF